MSTYFMMRFLPQGHVPQMALALGLLVSWAGQLVAATRPQEGYDGHMGALDVSLADLLNSSEGVTKVLDVLNASSRDVLEPASSEEAAAKNQFQNEEAKNQALQDCHNAEKGDYCHKAVLYAMHEGIKSRPDRYGGLTKDSSFHDFQLWLYEDGRYSCDYPCPTAESSVAAGEKKKKGSRRKRNGQHAVGAAHAGNETAAEDSHTGGSAEGGHQSTGGGAAHGGQGNAHSHHNDEPHGYLALCFLVGGVSIGCIVQVVQERFLPFIPFTCLLFVMGLAIGCLNEMRPVGHWSAWPTWYVSVQMWEEVSPHLVFYIFLPLLVFAEAMRLNINLAKRLFLQVLLLATVGVVIGTALTAVFGYYVLPYGWSWATCAAFGAILAATDPVAVVALFNTLGVSPRLTMLVSGESLLNDGTAIVLFTLTLKLMLGEPVDAQHVITFFLRMTTLSVILGIALAVVALVIIKQCAETNYHSDAMIQVAVTICLSMLCFFIAESEVHTSGVLAVVSAGCVISYAAWPNFTSRETMHIVWEAVEFIGNTVIFLLAGLLFGHRCYKRAGHLQWSDGLYLLLLYAAVTLIRAIIFVVLWPILNCLGQRVTWKEVVVMTWAGLRGAVGLVLAIIVDEEPTISQRIGSHFIFHIGGVAMLTIFVNATLCAPLLRALGFTTPPQIDEQIAHHFEKVTRDDARRMIEDIIQERTKDSKSRWANTDVDAVKGLLPALGGEGSHAEGHPEGHPAAEHGGGHHAAQHDEAHDEAAELRVYREAFMRYVQALYWEDIEEGLIPRTSQPAHTLLFSASDALQRSEEALKDWELIEDMCSRFQCCGRIGAVIGSCWPLSRSESVQGVFPSDATVDMWNAYISLTYIAAHSHARDEVPKFFSGSSVPSKKVMEEIDKESSAQSDQAAAFLEKLAKEATMHGNNRMLAGKLMNAQLEKVASLAKSGVLDGTAAAHIMHHLQAEHRTVAGSSMQKPKLAGKFF